VLLTGAGGVVGARVLERLLQRGYRVTATTHPPARLPWLRGLGAEATLLDLLDPVAVGELVARAEPDVIVHEMTAPTVRPDLRTSGTDHLLSAAQAAGIGRVVVQSYTGWTNARLEESVMQAPLRGVVLRYGNLYGAEGPDFIVDRVRRRRLPVVGEGRGVWSWVHVDDAAAATVAAIDRAAHGIYNVVDDDPAPVAEWLPYLATALGAKKPRKVPEWLGRLLLGEATTRWLTEGRGSSNVFAKRELDWRPAWASWRDGFRYAFEPENRWRLMRGRRAA
jgi:nucleoside-diphosphate-sugar epimerase